MTAAGRPIAMALAAAMGDSSEILFPESLQRIHGRHSG
jgi:hypothetical protein